MTAAALTEAAAVAARALRVADAERALIASDTEHGHRVADPGRLGWSRADLGLITRQARGLLGLTAAAPADLVAEGLAWYATARAEVGAEARALGLPFTTAAAVVAATSAGQAWSRNLRALRVVVAAERAVLRGATEADALRAAVAAERLGLPRTGYGPLRAGLQALRRGPDALRGRKVGCFYLGIVTGGQTDAVTVDGHAVQAADHGPITERPGITDARPLTGRGYALTAGAYAVAAAALGVTPARLQAVVWLAWRSIPTRGRR